MKKFLFRAAAACAVFGIAFCIIGAAAGGRLTGVRIDWIDGVPQVEYHSAGAWEYLTGDEPILGGAAAAPGSGEVRSFENEEIHSLEIELGGAQVWLEAADHWSVTVENDRRCTVRTENGVLNIETRGEGKTDDVVCTVTYPRAARLRSVEINLGGGSLQNLSALTCGTLELEFGAGSVVMNNVTVEGECSIDVGMGSVELNGSLARGAEIECGMGSVVCLLDAVDAYDYRVECGMGSVVLDDLEFSGMGGHQHKNDGAAVRYEIECGMGSVELHHS